MSERNCGLPALGDGGWQKRSETMNRRLDPGPLIIICKSEGSKHEKWDG
ncbi:hypothetical protein M6B38_144485 [Iris pallida]|uniref:Uncharacterized protein n=1 Tax=Iris pallida TaxID=29817 RepID=A0AAX6FAP7_IRIPA|nr:hypothetical protein M6B38_144485 [Iris pallida]